MYVLYRLNLSLDKNQVRKNMLLSVYFLGRLITEEVSWKISLTNLYFNSQPLKTKGFSRQPVNGKWLISQFFLGVTDLSKLRWIAQYFRNTLVSLIQGQSDILDHGNLVFPALDFESQGAKVGRTRLRFLNIFNQWSRYLRTVWNFWMWTEPILV